MSIRAAKDEEDNARPALATSLAMQCFAGNPLTRSLDVLSRFDAAATEGSSSEVSLVVVAGR